VSQRQLKQFRQRLKRIARIHRRGGGFEAAGTLGQSFYTRQAKRQQRPVLRPAITIVATLVTMKAVAAASMEEGAYAARVANLSGGTAIERAGALVMKPDPISRTLAQWMQPLIGPET
jgi:hypothetical protein